MTPIVLAALLREYTTQLETELYKLNSLEAPPRKRVWVKRPETSSLIPSPNWNIFPPTEDSDPEKWEWADDTDYVQPKYRALLAIVERMNEFTEEIKEEANVKSANE